MVGCQVHLLVSTLPDEKTPVDGRPFLCLSILHSKHFHDHLFVEVPASADTAQLLQHHLSLQHRCVTPSQLQALIGTAERAGGAARTPLMMTLLAVLASSWRSSTSIPVLPSSVREIISQFFEGLSGCIEREESKRMANSFVKSTLGLLTIARRGLSDTELQEVLSQMDDILADLHRWMLTPKVQMPWAPLLIVLGKLAPYLSRREQVGGGTKMIWYHRQFWETAQAVYLTDKRVCANLHGELADFFSGSWSEGKKPCSSYLQQRVGLSEAERFVRPQPLVRNNMNPLLPGAVYNLQRCGEALHHMVQEIMAAGLPVSKFKQRAQKELCSVEGVVARAMLGETFSLVSQGAKLVELLLGSDPVSISPEHFLRWLLRDAHLLRSVDQIVLSALRQPAVSKVREMCIELLRDTPSVLGLPRMVLGGVQDFSSIRSILLGHKGSVLCTAWFGDKIVSGDDKGVIIVWSAITGERIMEWKGHTSGVRSVAWSPNGTQIASGSDDKNIIVWDAESGEQEAVLKGHTRDVMTVAWSPNGSQLASGSDDGTIIVWDADSGEQKAVLKGHT